MLENCQQDRDDDAGEEYSRDQIPVADVLVGHIKTGQGGDKEADSDEEKEDLQRHGVVRFGLDGLA